MFTPSGAFNWMTWSLEFFTIIIGLSLLTGFVTPIAGALATLSYLVRGISALYIVGPHNHSDAIMYLNLSIISLALVLLGPGAFSMDARFFGHREIIIADGGRSRR
jgi:uncharacterized membrane protein YphA (DoxX/SURF4 family)